MSTLDAGEDRLIVDAFDRACAAYPRASVSYTHLTLPTILLV